MNGHLLEGIIVETEAYYGLDDPTSRAYHGIKGHNKPMWMEPGITFIYNVHKYWMLNVVAHESGKIGAVLIRAIEPTKGIEIICFYGVVAFVVFFDLEDDCILNWKRKRKGSYP